MLLKIREFIAKYTRRIFKPTLKIEPIVFSPEEQQTLDRMREHHKRDIQRLAESFGLSQKDID